MVYVPKKLFRQKMDIVRKTITYPRNPNDCVIIYLDSKSIGCNSDNLE